MGRHSRMALVLLGALDACVLCGCDRNPLYDEVQQVDAPVPAGNAVLFLDETRDRFTAVREEDGQVIKTTLPFEGHPDIVRVATTGNGPDDVARVLMLDFSRRVLSALDTANWSRLDYPLPSDFTAMSISEDGRGVVLYHQAGTQASASMVNTSELAYVDLEAGPAAGVNPTVATVTGLSRIPEAAFLSQPVESTDGTHRVAWLEATNVLGLVDIGQNGVTRTAVVPLAAPDSSAVIRPLDRSAVDGSGVMDLYVIATGSNDVIHVGVSLTGEDIEASLDQIASGASPSDLHVFPVADGVRVLTINAGSGDLALLDPQTGSGTYVTLETHHSSILPFKSDEGKPMAILWTPGSVRQSFLVVDVEDVPNKKGKAVEKVIVGQAVEAILGTRGGRHFLLVHPSTDTGLSVYDSWEGKLTGFGGTGDIQNVLLSGDGKAAYLMAYSAGRTKLSRLTLEDLHATSLSFQPAASFVAPLGLTGVALVGSGLGGFWVTAWPNGSLADEDGIFLEGFTLDGLM